MPEFTLPYRTDWQDLASVLEYAKGSGADRAALDARFGAGEAMRETLNALDQLGLVVRDESGGVRLTELGDRIAYAPDESDRHQVLVTAMLAYPPYRIPLERAMANDLDTIEAPWVEHIWQVDMRLGQPRNRVAEARTFFFRLADAAGLGTYRRGVRGQSTRLELSGSFTGQVESLMEQPASQPEPEHEEPTSDDVAQVSPLVDMNLPMVTTASSQVGLSVSVTVDMSDWDLDRIEAFFELLGLNPANHPDN